ncbi:MAG TPA: RcpC/CpaB family pilus assembly protein [Mycobacteriales bacterium]|nr:RcpC/CpaB family pilus assembly protein [Mycobacteriales bacterium]
MSDPHPRPRRLNSPRWLDGRLVLGVVLVLLSVVAGARVFAASSHYTSVYLARHQLTPGERLAPGDLAVGRVRFDGQGARYVAASRQPPVGYVVTHYVGANDFLPLDAVAARDPQVGDARFVTVPVQSGHLPSGLGHGDLVDVYVTVKRSGAGPVPSPSRVLSNAPVESTDAASELADGPTDSVVLSVPSAQVADLVHAVESGQIDLVRVPPLP